LAILKTPSIERVRRDEILASASDRESREKQARAIDPPDQAWSAFLRSRTFIARRSFDDKLTETKLTGIRLRDRRRHAF